MTIFDLTEDDVVDISQSDNETELTLDQESDIEDTIEEIEEEENKEDDRSIGNKKKRDIFEDNWKRSKQKLENYESELAVQKLFLDDIVDTVQNVYDLEKFNFETYLDIVGTKTQPNPIGEKLAEMKQAHIRIVDCDNDELQPIFNEIDCAQGIVEKMTKKEKKLLKDRGLNLQTILFLKISNQNALNISNVMVIKNLSAIHDLKKVETNNAFIESISEYKKSERKIRDLESKVRLAERELEDLRQSEQYY